MMNSLKSSSKAILLTLLIVAGLSSFAQTPEELAVMKPINYLFDGMKQADTSIISKAFAEDVVMKSVSKEKIVEENLAHFLKQIASKEPGTPDWIEKLYNTEIRIDGNLAHVWTEYSFYVGDQFSHCGVDSFSLIKVNGDWKIIFLLDTRRREGCALNK